MTSSIQISKERIADLIAQNEKYSPATSWLEDRYSIFNVGDNIQGYIQLDGFQFYWGDPIVTQGQPMYVLFVASTCTLNIAAK